MKRKLFLFTVLAISGLCVFAGEHVVAPYPNFGLSRIEEIMFLVLQIGVILFAAKLGGSLATILKMPSILGELGAGILIGPWALGGIGFCPEMFDGLFKDGLFHGRALRAMQAEGHLLDATSPALYGIATLASIVLLFLSGLETNLKQFLKYSVAGSLVGLGGVIFSFVLGDFCAVYFLPMFFSNVDWIQQMAKMSLPEAMMQAGPLYMGIMSTATSVGITARILSEKKKIDSEEGVTIMAGAVIDDVLGLIVLAIGNGIIAANMAAKTAGTSAGINWGEIGFVAIKAFGVWLGGTLIGCIFARKISWVLKLVKDPKVIGTLAFGLSMIVAGFFESMGLAMIIGAYVMGLSLSRTDLKHLIQENLEPVYAFLVPIFFCVMGMMVDVHALCSKSVLCFGAIYTALAVFAKIIGCALPSFCCGFNLLGSLRIGAGMVPRGEVALIIAGLGLSRGYLTPEIFGIGIFMTLITTMVAPPALVGMFHSSKKGVRHPKESMDDSRQIVYELANSAVAEIVINKLIAEFRKEDFFTVQLTNETNMEVWKVSHEKIEISLTRTRRKIRIECTPAEESVVNAAWTEVVSEMNELAKTISKVAMTRTAMEDDTPKSSTTGTASSCIREFVMLPNFKATSKIDAVGKMVDELQKAYPKEVVDVEEVKKAVMRREQSMPTGLDHGIAVPHGRTNGVTRLMGAVAIVDNSENENGIIPDWETIDHSKIQVIVLTLMPEKSQGPYLQVMAYLTHLLHNGSEDLYKCKTAEEMHKFFKKLK
ncbi:MAG: cation:proton antiporter [Kiritimatiellia bacterium]